MIKFSMRQLRKRILQPTPDLMREVGGIVPCDDSAYAHRQTRGAKVLAVAHCDYVDCGSDHFHAQNGMVWSSRLDDRLGVYVILDVLPQLGIECDVLLTDNEERGRSTAQYFAPDRHEYNWMFQFDRRGNDAVTYDYDNMRDYVKECFKLGAGSFSDISSLDHLCIGGVNIGVGYYDEHTLGSYAVLDELADQLERFKLFYDMFADEYISHEPWSAAAAGRAGIYRASELYYRDEPQTDEEWDKYLYDNWKDRWQNDMQ